jgi:hypothetical protein
MTVHDLVMHVGGFSGTQTEYAASSVRRSRRGLPAPLRCVGRLKEHYGLSTERLPAVEELDFVVRMRLGDKPSSRIGARQRRISSR